MIGTSTEVSHSQGDDDVREAVQLPSNFYPGEDSCRKSKKRAKKSKALIATLHAGSTEGLSAAQPAAQTPKQVDEAQDVQAPCVESPSRPSRLDLQHELECTQSHSPRPAAGETAAKINEMDRQQAVPNRTVQEAKEAKRLAREAREARKASKKARLRATIARLEQRGNSSPRTLRAPAVDTARKESPVSAKTCRRSGDVATPDNAQPQDPTLQGDSVRPGDNATPDQPDVTRWVPTVKPSGDNATPEVDSKATLQGDSVRPGDNATPNQPDVTRWVPSLKPSKTTLQGDSVRPGDNATPDQPDVTRWVPSLKPSGDTTTPEVDPVATKPSPQAQIDELFRQACAASAAKRAAKEAKRAKREAREIRRDERWRSTQGRSPFTLRPPKQTARAAEATRDTEVLGWEIGG